MTFMDNPVVLELIAPHLNTFSLAACVQVNHLWNTIFIPHLWSVIDDSQIPWNRLVDYFRDPSIIPPNFMTFKQLSRYHVSTMIERAPQEVLDLLIKYGHHIRRMVIHRPQTIELCLRARTIVLNKKQLQKAMESEVVELSLSLDNIALTSNLPTATLSPGMEKERALSNDVLLPCENLKVLRISFFDAELTFLKEIDDINSQEYLDFSDTLCDHQSELEPSLTGVPSDLFQKAGNADDKKLHLVTLARSCWQLVLNNRHLQELDMGPFGIHEEAFIPLEGFLKETLSSLPMLRAVRIGTERTTGFWTSLPTILPRLRMLWCYDYTTTSLNELVDVTDKNYSGVGTHSANMTTDRFEGNVNVIETMPNLQLLGIVSIIQPRHLKAILTHFPYLVTLSLVSIYQIGNTTRSKTGASYKIDRTISSGHCQSPLETHLRELHVGSWGCPVSSFMRTGRDIYFSSLTRLFLHTIDGGYQNILDLLRLMPSLQDFQLKKMSLPLVATPQPDYSIEAPFVRIKFISLGKEAFPSQTNLNGFLTLLPNLTEATLSTAYSSISSIIAQHCLHLEILELVVPFSNGHYSDLDIILANCTQLKCLVAPRCQISYQKLMRQPFVCKNLQVLDCVISDIPRLTSQSEEALRYICKHYNQNIFTPPFIGMPRLPIPDATVTSEWRVSDQNAIHIYSEIQEIMCSLFEKVTQETKLDRVVSKPIGDINSHMWTCSKQSRPKSSLGRPFKTTV